MSSVPFTIFRDNLHHMLKESELETMLFIIKENLIPGYWDKEEPLKALYTIALLDYLCKKHGMKIAGDYDKYRNFRLSKPFYVQSPASIELYGIDEDECIDEFKKYNIYEGDLYDAV